MRSAGSAHRYRLDPYGTWSVVLLSQDPAPPLIVPERWGITFGTLVKVFRTPPGNRSDQPAKKRSGYCIGLLIAKPSQAPYASHLAVRDQQSYVLNLSERDYVTESPTVCPRMPDLWPLSY